MSKCEDEDTCAHVSFIAIPIGPLVEERESLHASGPLNMKT